MKEVSPDSTASTAEPLAERLLSLAAKASMAIALLVAAVLIFGELGGDKLRGDEHNAIFFLKDGLVDYIKSFHYGHLIKIQFWITHEVFGNSFFWYRAPAALAAAAFAVWLAFYKVEGFPRNRISQSVVLLFVLGNEYLLDFARWGMPVYMQSILASSLLLGAVLADVMKGLTPRWTPARLLLIAVLPWLYPATVILLGSVSAFLLLLIVFAKPGRQAFADIPGFVRRASSALIPLLLGGLSLAIFRLSVPDAQWQRARGHHISYKDWVHNDQGGVFGFLADSLTNLGRDVLQLVSLGNTPSFKMLSAVYALVGLLIAASIAAALATGLVRMYRFRQSRLPADLFFIRGSMFLLTCIISSLVVTNVASVLDAYPTGGLRHDFFLIPVLALLAIISSAYLGYFAVLHSHRGLGRIVDMCRAAGAIGVVFFGGLLAVVAIGYLRHDSQDFAKLLSIIHSPKNDIVLSWQPGFYISKETLPAAVQYFQVDRGTTIPEVLAHAIEARGRGPSGGRIAVLTKSSFLNDGADSGAWIWQLVKEHDLRMQEQSSHGAYSAVAFEILPRGGAPKSETIELTVDLPAGNIVSIRLDPTQWLSSAVTINELTLNDQNGPHPIDVCSDRRLVLVRSVRLGGSLQSGCNLVVGNNYNTGWIGPSSLRNLANTSSPRSLRIKMTGELSEYFRVYVDVGHGYSSPILVKTAEAHSK